jgi:type IV pilus assembly protein PilY1
MNQSITMKRFLAYALIGSMTAQPAFAASTDIATIPLASAAGASVLPNLLFTLDSSGSMDWDYLPDFVNDSNTCMRNGSGSATSGSSGSACAAGDPPYYAGGQHGFNGVAYDPNLTYAVGLKSDGTTVLSSSSLPPSTYTIKNDAYGAQSTSSTNITTGVTDKHYCNPNNVCRRNGADNSTGNVLPATAGTVKDPFGNTLQPGQFPYRTNPSNASDPAVISFGMPEMMSIASFSRSGSTITATTVEPHGLSSGNIVYVAATGSSNFDNNAATITVDSTTQFHYTGGSSGSSPRSGSYRKEISGTWARPTTGTTTQQQTITVVSNSHGLVTGDQIYANSDNSNETGTFAITKIDANQFSYVSSSSGSSSGNVTWVRNGLYNNTNTASGPAVSYYITPVEWCSDVNLTLCVRVTPPATPPADHPFPAYVRYCQSLPLAVAPATAISGNDASGNALCRGKYVNSGVIAGVSYVYPRFGWFSRDTIQSGVSSYANRPGRSDTGCSSGTCTYAAEILNYATWWTYYRTRMQMMKTAAGRAFVGFVSNPPARPDTLRVGFITINPFYPNQTNATQQSTVQSSRYLRIDTFNTTNAPNWYTKFYAQVPDQSTPLREAVSRAGWIFAGKLNTGLTAGIPTTDDPMLASCQRNFNLMTTDGFWNGNGGQDIAGADMGNLDAVNPTIIAPYTQVMVDRATTVTFDGVGASTVTTTPTTTLEQKVCTGGGTVTFANGSSTSCGCPANLKRVKQSTTLGGTTSTSVEGQSPVPGTVTPSSTFQDITACNALQVATTTQPVTVTETKICTGSGSVTFADGTTTSCQCSNSSRNVAIKETRTGTTKTSITFDGGTAVVTYSGGTTTLTYSTNSTAGSGFGSTNPTSCSSNSLSSQVVAQNVNTTGSTTTSSTTGSTISNSNITITPNPQTAAGTQFSTTTAGTQGNTLADAALYYYQTDLRGGTDVNSNGTGPSTNLGGTGTVDVSANNIPTAAGSADFVTAQHLVTFTVGMADGLMRYQSDYATASSGDFANIKAGTLGACFWTPGFCDWPAPTHDDPSALDDLWHAAVNGRGQYYQALNANALSLGLTSALSALNTQVASAAAAATSSPNVTQTDNQAFSTTYETTVWSGKIFMQLLDPATAQPSPTIQWQADSLLLNKVTPSSDTRNILTADSTSSTGLSQLDWSNTSIQGYFTNACTNNLLTQCGGSVLSGADKTTVDQGQALLGFLRGQTGNERTPTCTTGCLFRDRVAVDTVTNTTTQTILGDTVDAKPVFVRNPTFSYTDAVTPTYASFQAANANRAARVFVGANDGYLHAFDANTGDEVWAYAPRFLLASMYVLADTNYTNKHRFFVDGTPQSADVFDATAGAWKTIVVGGTGAGGRGFYALDVTDPNNPKGLWEFCANSSYCSNNDVDLGYSYANPIIGKRSFDGKWVVVLTSGLNNGTTVIPPDPAGSGGGFFYVLDAVTGQLLNKVATNNSSGVNVGTGTTPSGLMHMAAFFNTPLTDATFQYVYAGDQLGNVWRLDMSPSKPKVTHVAQLMDKPTGSSPRAQPITTPPVLTFINSQRVLYVGTGRYLGQADLSDPGSGDPAWQQSLYAFKDKGTDYGNIRDDSNMVLQQFNQQSPTTRGVTGTPVSWTTKDGWMIDFNPTFPGDPAAGNSPGERVNVNMQLVLGTLIVTTTVPNLSGTASCVSGGFSFQYDFDFKSGLPVSGTVVGSNMGQLIVGSTAVETTTGQIYDLNKFLPGQFTPTGVPISGSVTGVKRFSYRAF